MPSAGQIIRALDFTAAVSDTQDTAGTTTSATYTTTLTTGTTCGVAFVAPTSGNVVVVNAATLDHSTTGDTWMSFQVRDGAVVGSGTVVLGTSDTRSILHNGTAAERQGFSFLVTGLTPGSSYNVRQAFRTSGATATYSDKFLAVTPTT